MSHELAQSITIAPGTFYRNVWEHMRLSYNRQVADIGLKALQNHSPDAIYARYSLDSYVPVIFSRELDIPLILEYNGSEIWVSKHWGSRLRHPALAEKIEEYVIRSADMITVVSQPLKDELLKRGIDGNRILVNPNAVDPEMFDPGRFSSDEIKKLRSELGIPDGRIVAGFIGTFGQWHGVEVLARAIPVALKNNPNLHFLLIGGGLLYGSVKELLKESGVLDRVAFTGIIPQRDAPKYLMCADFFLSPHVPNPDGTPFFGSPTKLFEYMALGKGIIASDLDQIGEILEHGKTALLVKPGDPDDLAKAINTLYNDMALVDRLGKAARELVLEKYTWDAHVGKILDHLYNNVSFASSE
ncbi:MAG: glycosyltransferase family 4 protein [bacterium]|nr:glycosyltransferase family 4 protein [bacterium]